MQQSYRLSKESLLTLPTRAGSCIAVESGVIWFTAAGADIVLGRGHSYQLAQDEALLIQALADTRFSLRSEAHTVSLPLRLANLFGRNKLLSH
jgi:hypothetical protein